MRESLRGLTVRGRCFLAAGGSAVVCSFALGQSTLLRVGVLLLALPLLTAYAVARGRYRLSLTRTVTPSVVSAGQAAEVALTLRNDGRMPSGALRVEEQLPYALGSRPRFVVERIEHGWRRRVTYPVRAEVRGRYDLGPMSVRVGDPFGLVELTRTFRSTTQLVVTPRTVALPSVPLEAAQSGSGDHRPRAFAGGSAEDVTVRDYRRGDDLRRVHWRSSARVGALMVRREEQPWQSRATVFLDNRAGAHRGHGLASSLETAVVAAASVAAHLSRRGYAVRLVTASGEEPASAWHSRDADVAAGQLLEALAMVRPEPTVSLEAGWLGEHGSGGVTVAVLGSVAGTDLPVLRRMLHHSGLALAMALDVDAWGPTQLGSGGSTGLLLQQGWRAATVLPDTRIDQAWQALGSRGPRGRGRDHATS